MNALDPQVAPRPEAAPSPRRWRIVVVDDNQDSADSLSLLLEVLGHRAEVAYDGPSGLALAERSDANLVFLDIGMPGMDGYEVARRLRAAERTRGAFIVATTGWGQSEDRRRSQEAGFDLHLVKPIDFADIERVLAR